MIADFVLGKQILNSLDMNDKSPKTGKKALMDYEPKYGLTMIKRVR